MVKNKLYSSGNNGLGYVLMSGYGDHYYIPYTWYNIGGTGAALGDDGVHWLSAERSSLNGYFYLPNSWLSDANGYTPFASAVAGQIDGKIDDGLPLTGNVRMISAGPTNANLGVMNAGYPEYGNCATTNVPATSRYKSEDSKVFASGRMGCRLGFKSQF